MGHQQTATFNVILLRGIKELLSNAIDQTSFEITSISLHQNTKTFFLLKFKQNNKSTANLCKIFNQVGYCIF